jgi:hypothetical protein
VEGRKRERRSIVAAAARPSTVAPESPVEWTENVGDRQSRRRSSRGEPTAFIGTGNGLRPSPIPRTRDIFPFNTDFILGPFLF